jgi:tol-pal system protein YbgF
MNEVTATRIEGAAPMRRPRPEERPMIHRATSLTTLLAACSALAVGGLVAEAEAQQTTGSATAQARPAGKAPAPAAKSPAGEAIAAPSGSEAGLRARVEQLEEQLVDMQVVIGTLESLARGGVSASSAANRGAPLASGDETRLAAMEQQIRTLSALVEQMRNERARPQGSPAAAVAPAVGGFGQTTVSQDKDPIGQILAPSPAAVALPGVPPAGASDASPKQLYEAAYGHLLQQDYAAAETTFDEFLRRYPNDQLAGNAQYWLGETHFVRGQFKAAANAFLKGYQTYGRSTKAADSLLKLAMSLDRLGQRDAACSSYSELTVKFPSAPANVKARADSERRRLGCA